MFARDCLFRLFAGTVSAALRFRSTLTLERKACRKGCLQPEL